MAEFENPFADPEAQNLFHVSSVVVNLLAVMWSFELFICTNILLLLSFSI